jgi:hypothetical protein
MPYASAEQPAASNAIVMSLATAVVTASPTGCL